MSRFPLAERLITETIQVQGFALYGVKAIEIEQVCAHFNIVSKTRLNP